MEKSYRDTKEFLIEKLIEDIASQKQIELKIKEHSLTQREYLFNTISLTCKMLYHKKKLPDYLIEELKSCGVKKLPSGWFYIDNESFKGKFINANAIFKHAYCKSAECHKCAYHFIIDYKMDDMKLSSGTIKPYDVGEGFLHSICFFKKDDEEYVFDGANFLLMNKNFYYDLFNFQEIQSISREEVLKDRATLSHKLIKNGILKSKSKYQPIKNQSNLAKRFSGMGFIIYLYNREAIVESDLNIDELERENNLARKKLNQKLEKIYGDDAHKF